jgi:hypothetical protein
MSLKKFPCIRLDDVIFHSDAHLSSIICLDDENFLSRPPSVSRSFQLLSVASFRKSQQRVRTTFSIQQEKDFFPKHRYGKTATTVRTMYCSCLHAILDKASHAEEVQPFERQTPWSGQSSLNMEIVCNRSATVRMLGQHLPDAALFRKEY